LEELVKHGLVALRETLQTGDVLTVKNVSIGIVGENHKFEIVEGERLQAYLNVVEEPQDAPQEAQAEAQPEPMQQ